MFEAILVSAVNASSKEYVGTNKFLRTGDTGSIYHKQLFITGRIKDMIILNGTNIYPHDIEATVYKSSDSIKNGTNLI
jgi:acyl-CoA synthetase (AMP-forming)/AMP-acid ligase II